jgi:hypothetical protein
MVSTGCAHLRHSSQNVFLAHHCLTILVGTPKGVGASFHVPLYVRHTHSTDHLFLTVMRPVREYVTVVPPLILGVSRLPTVLLAAMVLQFVVLCVSE